MAAYSFHLNRLGFGETQLDLQKIQSRHRTRLESSLSRNLFNQKTVHAYFDRMAPKIDFDFTVGRKGAALQARGDSAHRFTIEEGRSKELQREVGGVVRYYQHIGSCERAQDTTKEAATRRKAAKVAVKAIAQSAVPGSNGKIVAMANVSENVLSLARDVVRSVPGIGPDHPLPHNVAYPVGAIWAGFSVLEARGGYRDYKRAVQIGDSEGKRRAMGRCATGGLATVGSVFFLAGKASASAGAAALTTLSLSMVADVAFGIVGVVGIGLSSLGIHRCRTFKNRLNEYYQNKELSKEQQVKGTLEFLLDHLTVTPEERKKFISDIEEKHPNLSPQEKEALLNQKMRDLAEVKVKYLKRRTSNKSLDLILNKVEPLLSQLANPETKKEAIEEADLLIRSVLKETHCKMALYILGLVASILGLIGTLLCDFFSLGSVPFIIMGIGSFISLMLTCYNLIVRFLNKESVINGLLMQPLDVSVGAAI